MEVGVYNHQINVKKSKRSKMAALISNRLTSEYAKIEDFILKRYYLIGRWKSNALVNTKTSVLKSFPLQVISSYVCMSLQPVLAIEAHICVAILLCRGHSVGRSRSHSYTTVGVQTLDTSSWRNLHRSIFAAAAAQHATPKAAYSRGQMDEWSISTGTQRRHRRDLTALRLFFGWTNWLVVGRGDPRAGQWLKQTRTVGQKLVTWWYIADHMAEMGICDPDHIQVFISLPATFLKNAILFFLAKKKLNLVNVSPED